MEKPTYKVVGNFYNILNETIVLIKDGREAYLMLEKDYERLPKKWSFSIREEQHQLTLTITSTSFFPPFAVHTANISIIQ